MDTSHSTSLRSLVYDAVSAAIKDNAPEPAPASASSPPEQLPVAAAAISAAPHNEFPLLMSAQVLAERIEVDPKTLERWRKSWPRGACTGPKFSKLPGTKLYRYTREDVLEWISAGSCIPG